MGKIILLIIGLLIAIFGVIMIFDARFLTQKFFSFGDQNEATAGFKIIGFFPCSIKSFLLVPVILKQIPVRVYFRKTKIKIEGNLKLIHNRYRNKITINNIIIVV